MKLLNLKFRSSCNVNTIVAKQPCELRFHVPLQTKITCQYCLLNGKVMKMYVSGRTRTLRVNKGNGLKIGNRPKIGVDCVQLVYWSISNRSVYTLTQPTAAWDPGETSHQSAGPKCSLRTLTIYTSMMDERVKHATLSNRRGISYRGRSFLIVRANPHLHLLSTDSAHHCLGWVKFASCGPAKFLLRCPIHARFRGAIRAIRGAATPVDVFLSMFEIDQHRFESSDSSCQAMHA